MDRDALAKHLKSLFLVELEDHERTLEHDLLALERAQDETVRAELVENIFRAAHSLKGAARAVHATTIETICHRLEHALSALRGQPSAVDEKLVQSLLLEVDGVKAAANRLRVEAQAESSALQRASSDHASPVPAASRSEPTSAPVTPASAPARPSPPANTNAQLPTTTVIVEPTTPAPGPAKPRSTMPPGPEAPRTTPRVTPAEARAARVSTQKLDALIASSGDLLVASTRAEARLGQLTLWREKAARAARLSRSSKDDERERLQDVAHAFLELERDLDGLESTLRQDVSQFSSASRRVDDEIRRLRMVPFREACEGLERSVRDLGRALGKEVTLVAEGEQVELDRELAQRLRDPLQHLVRNAISHGIEPADERVALGKPRLGTITLRSELRGSLVEVSLSDDGRGLDLARIRARARELGLPEVTDDDELASYVFVSGLSTAAELNEISGRGVGLDAVKRSIESLHGTVSVASKRGQGARFVVRLPLTLSKLRCLLLRVAGAPYAVPTSHAVRVLRFSSEQILNIGGRELVRAESELVPLVSCAELFGLPETARGADEQAQALVVSNAGRSVALIVGALLDERETIVHKLPRRVAGSPYLSGATVLARGRVAPVVNGSELARAALADVARTHGALFAPPKASKQRVLVVDDSITTRALIKSIVESGGYDVTAARDGNEAFKLLHEQPFTLVVSDVQMPNMDGFTLTENIRKTPAFANIPVVLVTSLEGESDRMRGLEAGANAYLGKSAFDHRTLLEVLEGLL